MFGCLLKVYVPLFVVVIVGGNVGTLFFIKCCEDGVRTWWKFAKISENMDMNFRSIENMKWAFANFCISSKESPAPPQHSDSHPCTRPMWSRSLSEWSRSLKKQNAGGDIEVFWLFQSFTFPHLQFSTRPLKTRKTQLKSDIWVDSIENPIWKMVPPHSRKNRRFESRVWEMETPEIMNIEVLKCLGKLRDDWL